MKYSVGLGAVAEQYFQIDADDPDTAIEEAMAQHELYDNISNKFVLGDPLVLGVWDESDEEVVKSEL